MPDDEECREEYKNRIDDIEIKSPKKECEIAGCNTVSSRTEWRHKCCRYSNSWERISLLDSSDGDDTDDTTSKCYNNIEEVRTRTSEEF